MNTSTPKRRKDMTPDELKVHKAEIAKRYYEKHKSNPEFVKKLNAANLNWYYSRRADPEFLADLNEKRREYYQTRKDEPEFKKAKSEKARRAANGCPWKGIVRGAMKRAVLKGVPFDVDLLEWAPTVWTGRCALTGIEFKRGIGAGPAAFSPSIDRIKPEIGYVKTNCRFILHGLNALKSTGTDEEMWLIIRAMVAAQPA